MNRAAQYESKQKKALDLLGCIRGSSGSSSRGLKISDDSSRIEITSSSLSSSSSSSTTSSMKNVVSPDNDSASAMAGVSHIKQHGPLKGDPSSLFTDDDSYLYSNSNDSCNSLPLGDGSSSSSVNDDDDDDDDDDEDEQDRSSDPLNDEELIKVCIIVVGDVCISCW